MRPPMWGNGYNCFTSRLWLFITGDDGDDGIIEQKPETQTLQT